MVIVISQILGCHPGGVCWGPPCTVLLPYVSWSSTEVLLPVVLQGFSLLKAIFVLACVCWVHALWKWFVTDHRVPDWTEREEHESDSIMGCRDTNNLFSKLEVHSFRRQCFYSILSYIDIYRVSFWGLGAHAHRHSHTKKRPLGPILPSVLWPRVLWYSHRQ